MTAARSVRLGCEVGKESSRRSAHLTTMWNDLDALWWKKGGFAQAPTFSSSTLKYCVLIVYVCNMNSIGVGLRDPRLDTLLGVASELQVNFSVDQRPTHTTNTPPHHPAAPPLHYPAQRRNHSVYFAPVNGASNNSLCNSVFQESATASATPVAIFDIASKDVRNVSG